MSSDEEGNKNQEGKKGIKRKYEESAEESANKHLCSGTSGDGASTSTGITHDDRGRNITAEGNVRKIPNWMRFCDVEYNDAKPRCYFCDQHFIFYINPSTFKDHYKIKHPDNYTEGVHDSEWMIFNYFKFVRNAQHLECKICDESLEVLEFKGEFVDHFYEQHEERAERTLQRGNEDVEVAERLRLTTNFINYLHDAFKIKRTEGYYDVRIIAWWMKYVKRVERNRVYCNISNCQNELHPFPIDLRKLDIKTHVRYHNKNEQFGINMNNRNHFSFDNYILRCKHCDKMLTYYLYTGFQNHLKNKHHITSPYEGCQSTQNIDTDDATNERINELMLYLIDKMKFKHKRT